MQQIFNETATPLIKEQVRKLIGKHGFTTSDREDLEQELALEVLTELGKRTAAPDNPGAFIRCMIERRTMSLVRRREAEGRDHRRTESIHADAAVLDDDGLPVELGDTLPDDHHGRRLAADHLSDLKHVQIRDDVEAVIAKLPDDLKKVCRQLQAHSAAEAARRLGVDRNTVVNAIGRIRAIFAEAGLDGWAR